MTGFSDEGTFFLYGNGARLGVIHAKITPSGAAETKTIIWLGGKQIETSSVIEPDADGRWKKITNKTPGSTTVVTRDVTRATITGSDKPSTVQLREGALPLDPDSLPQMSLILRRYDRARGRFQTFPMFTLSYLSNETPLDVRIEMRESMERSFTGKSLKLTKFQLYFPGSEAFLWADADGRIYLYQVPEQKSVVVREGYEDLLLVPGN
jgi:hypothetical protein